MSTRKEPGLQNRNDAINNNNNDRRREDGQTKEKHESKIVDKTIRGVCIKDYDIENKEVFYNIIVRTSQSTWVSKKRYHEFDELNTQLLNTTYKILPLLPTKHSKLFIDHTDIDFIEKRRALLNNYVKKLLKLNDFAQNHLVVNFLNEGKTDLSIYNENKRNGDNKKDFISNENEQEITHISILQSRKIRGHVLYHISVMNNRRRGSFRKWIQLKRFTQFYEMDCKLRESLMHTSFNLGSLPHLPPRRCKFIQDHMDSSFIEKRRLLLENYLLRLLKMPEIATNDHFLEFLGVRSE